MIESKLDTVQSILYVHLKSAFEQADFVKLAEEVDSYIEANGELQGLIIEATSFPGWDSFGALIAHMRFVRDHHQRIKKIALVTDSVIGNVAEHLASHFVAAQIKHFSSAEIELARQWITIRP
jgi:hypothetical protein